MLKQLARAGYTRGDEDWKWCVDLVAVQTALLADEGQGLRLRRERLTDEEATSLVLLTKKAVGEEDGFSLRRLKKSELVSWESLAEKAGGKESGSVFEAARSAAKVRKGFREIARELAKPKARIDTHELGSVTLARRVCFDFFDRPDPAITISTLGWLTFISAQFENGAALGRHARLEGSGDDAVLSVDLTYGFGSHFDRRQDVSVGMERSLMHLATLDLLRVERHGPELRIRQGPKLLRANRRVA